MSEPDDALSDLNGAGFGDEGLDLDPAAENFFQGQDEEQLPPDPEVLAFGQRLDDMVEAMCECEACRQTSKDRFFARVGFCYVP